MKASGNASAGLDRPRVVRSARTELAILGRNPDAFLHRTPSRLKRAFQRDRSQSSVLMLWLSAEPSASNRRRVRSRYLDRPSVERIDAFLPIRRAAQNGNREKTRLPGSVVHGVNSAVLRAALGGHQMRRVVAGDRKTQAMPRPEDQSVAQISTFTTCVTPGHGWPPRFGRVEVERLHGVAIGSKDGPLSIKRALRLARREPWVMGTEVPSGATSDKRATQIGSIAVLDP